MLRNPFSGDAQNQSGNRKIPILPSSTKTVEPHMGDPMELTPSPGSMGPPGHSSPEVETTHASSNGPNLESAPTANGSGVNGVSAAAATSSQQPKVVQTAFIHKLYKWGTTVLDSLDMVLKADMPAACWRTRTYKT